MDQLTIDKKLLRKHDKFKFYLEKFEQNSLYFYDILKYV